MAEEKATITAQNTFTDGLIINNQPFTVSIGGTFSATVTVQRKKSDEADADYRDVKSYTAPIEENGYGVGKWVYRVGVKTGDFTSGSIDISINDGV
tara:strand:+ start:234 stop:521 length:288 start_codon:yes stop_codon:yes gene_type:complete